MMSMTDIRVKFDTAREKYMMPDMIIDGFDYLSIFSEFDTFEELHEEYKTDIFKITTKNLIYCYCYVKGELTDVDEEYIMSNFPDITIDVINAETKKLKDRAELFNETCKEYDEINNQLDEIEEIPHEIIEVSKTKTYVIKSVETGELLDLSDIVDVFNKLEPSVFVQMIVYCDSVGKLIYKVSTDYPIRFNYSNVTYEPNTISLFYEIVKKTGFEYKQTVLNFEKSICSIEVFMGRQYDNTQFFIIKGCEKFIKFEPNNSYDIISGEIEFELDADIQLFTLYENMILNNFISYLFRVDERKKPFFLQPNEFKMIYYDPMVYCLFYFIGNKNYPSITFTAKENAKTKDKYTIGFKASNNEIISSAAKTLSKILSLFSENTSNSILNYDSKFYSTTFDELKNKIGFLLESVDNSSSEAFHKTCTSYRQPLYISESDVQFYEEYGKQVGALEHEGVKYHFTCMSDKFPHIKFPIAKAIYLSGIKQYPCCYKTEKFDDTKVRSNIKDTGALGSTSYIKDFSKTSKLDQVALEDFIKTNFSKSGNASVKLIGTCLSKISAEKRSLNDSCIGAMIFATEQYDVYSDTGKKIVEISKLKDAFSDVRRRLIELPFEIYKQELYDVTYEQFVENVSNPNHYIDPYLYYRGLEVLFNVNIFVFTSNIIKSKTSSFEELTSELPTLEIPRCYEYHTRMRNNKGIVSIYKNYGSKSLIGKNVDVDPSCELIAISNTTGKDNIISVVEAVNSRYSDRMWEHFYRCCTPFMFQHYDGDIRCYNNPYVQYDHVAIGEQIGETLQGQEIDIHGKTRLLIYESINIVVPGIQPILLTEDIPPPIDRTEVTDKEYEYYEYQDYTFRITPNGNNTRAGLFEKKEIMKIFDITEHDDEGCFMKFAGNPRGIKILCHDDERLKVVSSRRNINDIIDEENNVSALLQIINWLWRSEYYNEKFPQFDEWFPEHVVLVEPFDKAEQPIKCLNNFFLPKFSSYDERINYLEILWPFFFEEGKIKLYDKLYLRILNLMNVQDYQTRAMAFDSFYTKIPSFITNLTPTDNDYEKKGSLVFTKKEHMEKWLKYTNRSLFGSVSLTNMKIVNTLIFPEFYSTTVPYIFNNRNEPELNKIYIIQNVSDGEKYDASERTSALEIAYRYKQSKQNIGPGVKRQTFPNGTKYVVYEVKTDGQLVATEDYSGGKTDYLRIIKYKKANYCAMLELL